MKTATKNMTRRSFTIVEMVVVMGMAVILFGLAAAATHYSSSDAKLKNATRLLAAQLNLARAKAVAERKNVGVVFAHAEVPTDQACRIGYYTEAATPVFSSWVPGEELLAMPGNIVCRPTAGAPVVFNAAGQLVNQAATIGVYSGKTFAKADTDHYYKIDVAQYTGRSKVTFVEKTD